MQEQDRTAGSVSADQHSHSMKSSRAPGGAPALSLVAAAVAALLGGTALAQDAKGRAPGPLEIVQVIGSAEDARQIAGSGAVIEPEQIRVEANTDINQLLKTVPGIYIREEEGQGLRPNIGIRAASGGRSSKVTLMVDGVLIAPAPYSNPAAYYFPEAYRMDRIEVLKGAPLLRHGPQTTGGVINLLTPAIPDEPSGAAVARFGRFSTRDVHAYYGGTTGGFGWLVDTVQRSSRGFKTIDRSGRDAGFDIEDYMVKLGWSGERQSVVAKIQYSEQVSDETYAGLTDADFAANPNRRYGLSEIDQMDNEHESYTLTYRADLGPNLALSAIAYDNYFARDWFKGSLGSLVDAANAGDSEALEILHGTRDVAGMEYVHGNRAYDAYGLELNLDVALGDHAVQVGARDHTDEMDRWQPVEIYDQVDGSLVFRQLVEPTGGNNRIERADALSFWVTDEWQVGDALKLNLALRHEDVDSSRRQFADPDRGVLASSLSNSTSEWLPGASMTYDIGPEWQVLAGVHRGFAPLGGGASANQEPETSVNYEAGIRFGRDELFVEAIAFRSDFDNQAESCSIANPCSNGATSGSFVTSEAVVNGLELQLANAWRIGNVRVPLHATYTWTDAEISKDNPTTGVADGDVLADIPENLFSLRLGFETGIGWDNHLVVKHMDETCISVGCNRLNDPFGRTESLTIADIISRYSLTDNTVVFFKVENVTDEQVIIARTPHGARPNKPRTSFVGIELRL